MEGRIDLVKLTLTEDGNLFAGVYSELKENLSEAQLELILDYVDGIARVIREMSNATGELNQRRAFNEKEGT